MSDPTLPSFRYRLEQQSPHTKRICRSSIARTGYQARRAGSAMWSHPRDHQRPINILPKLHSV